MDDALKKEMQIVAILAGRDPNAIPDKPERVWLDPDASLDVLQPLIEMLFASLNDAEAREVLELFYRQSRVYRASVLNEFNLPNEPGNA